jgi:hypothetical protein
MQQTELGLGLFMKRTRKREFMAQMEQVVTAVVMNRSCGQSRSGALMPTEKGPWTLNTSPAAGLHQWRGAVMTAANRDLAIT